MTTPTSESPQPPTREEIYHTAQQIIAEKDLFAATAYVLSLGNEAHSINAFTTLVLDAHHKAKSTEQVIHFAQAGITFCLTLAAHHDGIGNTKQADAMRLFAKQMATNAASFCWPGWNEPGITITPEQHAQGLAFARYSIRQLKELDYKPGQLGFSLFFLGIQLMSHHQHEAAADVFHQAIAINQEANDNPDGLLMLQGYLALNSILAGEGDAAEQRFNETCAALQARNTEDSNFFAKQLVDVRKVLEQR